jgi:hypothetical protein
MATSAQQDFLLSPYWVDGLGTSGFDWEKFQDKIDALSENLYNLLIDEATSTFIKMLTQKYAQLSIQGSDIARIIRDVILTDVYIGDMPAQISSKLGIDQNTALEMARAIVSQLFAPVIDDIKKLQLQKFGKLPSSSQQQPTIPQKVPGEELPETGGNIIDLRGQK